MCVFCNFLTISYTFFCKEYLETLKKQEENLIKIMLQLPTHIKNVWYRVWHSSSMHYFSLVTVFQNVIYHNFLYFNKNNTFIYLSNM